MSPRREELSGVIEQRRLRQRFLAELEPDEPLLSYGSLRESWDYVAVTPRRIIINEGLAFLWSLPFDRVTGVQEEIFESHRYRLFLWHERVDLPPEPTPYPWDIPQHVRRSRRRRDRGRRTFLEFSRHDTAAAETIRQQLRDRLGDQVFADPPSVVPHHRDKHVAPLVKVGRLRAWWIRRGLRHLED